MQRLSISEACEVLDVKPHVLRYWERNVPLLQPAKSASGRRAYSRRDLDILFRLKYLLYQRKFTLDGASQKLIEEAEGSQADAKGAINGLRSTLVDARRSSSLLRQRVDTLVSSRSVDWELVQWLARREEAETGPVAGWPYRRSPGGTGRGQDWGRDRRGLAVVSPGPNWNVSPSSYPVQEPVSLTGRRTILDVTARKLRLLHAQRRDPVPWIIPVPARMQDVVRSLLVEAQYFGLPRELVSVVSLNDLADVSGIGYTSPMASFWAGLALGRIRVPENVETLLWVPLDTPYETLPSVEAVALHRRQQAEVTALVWERPRPMQAEGGSSPPMDGRPSPVLIPTGSLIMERSAVDNVIRRLRVRTINLRQDVISRPVDADQQYKEPGGDAAAAAAADESGSAREPRHFYVGIPELLSATEHRLILARSGAPPLFVRTREEARRCRALRYATHSPYAVYSPESQGPKPGR